MDPSSKIAPFGQASLQAPQPTHLTGDSMISSS